MYKDKNYSKLRDKFSEFLVSQNYEEVEFLNQRPRSRYVKDRQISMKGKYFCKGCKHSWTSLKGIVKMSCEKDLSAMYLGLYIEKIYGEQQHA